MQSIHLGFVDYLILAIYFSFVLGIGWALPFSSIVRDRKVYSPTGKPGSNTAQCTLLNRIGQVRGFPRESKPCVSSGIASPGKPPPQVFGGPRICASTHGAVLKERSCAGNSCEFG